MLRTTPLSDEDRAEAHKLVWRDLNVCREVLRKEIGGRHVPATAIPESLQAYAHAYSSAWLKRLHARGRIEYFLSRRPMHLLRVHVGAHAAARFKALWNDHLPLCYFFAKRYEKILGIDFNELVSHASEGVMLALARFDPDKGSFSSYAAHWIKHCILRGILWLKRPMHIPYCAIQRAEMPNATPEETEVLSYRTCALDVQFGFERVAAFLGITPFRATQGLSPFMTRQDFIADPDAEEAYDAQSNVRDGTCMMDELITVALTPFEKAVVDARLQEPAPSYKKIGVAYNLSRERIRQVHNIALRKIRKRLRAAAVAA